MHTIEPYYNWREIYQAEEDALSPFYGREYSEFEFSNTIYNYYIHPQWDSIGSPTLFVKILYADYSGGHAIIELLGEWNDCINNDIMYLKRDIVDILIENGINKFILIGENVFNFHYSDESYYEEWFDDIEDGWIVLLNFREHILKEMKRARIDYYLVTGGKFNEFNWRKLSPERLIDEVDDMVTKRLGA
jgi:hypothetical protein